MMSNLPFVQTIRNNVFKLLAGLSLGLFSIGAMATPIDIFGEIGFGGILTDNATSVDQATELTFGNAFVTFATDDFAGDITPGNSATFNFLDLADPFMAVEPLWTVNGTSLVWYFDLTSITNIVRNAVTQSLSITGKGVLRTSDENQFNETNAEWSLSADQTGVSIAFSSTTSVPEPASIAILGLGLIGLAYSLRRRKTTDLV